MSRDRIQDYLDGRLSGKERAAFEARLAREPELARRVEEYESIGRALREDEPVLSPGFYTRARARFEQTSGAGRQGWRWLSWEAAGLSAAVILAAAVFLPGLLRQEETFTPPEGAAGQVAPAEEVRSELEEAPAPKDREADVASENKKEAMGFAPVPPRAEPDQEAGAGEKGKADLDVVEAQPMRQRLEARSKPATVVGERVTLPAGTVAPGTVRITDETKDQAVDKRSAAKPSAEAFAQTAARRLVLIGARAGMRDCSSVLVEATEKAYIVHVPPAEAAGDEPGPDCAIIFPSDEREILLLEPTGHE